jgi:hypothetical protein
MNNRLGREGLVKGIFLLLILVALVFVVFEFAKPYYRYNTLRSHTKDTLVMQIGDANAIRKEIKKEADNIGVPLREQDILVTYNVTSKVMKVKASWSEVVDFWGYYQKEFDFELDVEY